MGLSLTLQNVNAVAERNAAMDDKAVKLERV